MALFCRCMLFFAVANAFAADLNLIGVTTLRSFEPGLTGATIRIAQAEAPVVPGAWQVGPAAVGHPQSLFTWVSSAGSATTFPNALGSESSHADSVGSFLYGAASGVAPGVSHVDNYEAQHFLNSIVPNQTAIPAKVVNQSFVLGMENSTVDRNYDRYAARYNVLFVSGVGNGVEPNMPNSPATAYNGVAVGAMGGQTSFGPTLNTRCKPDITVPDGFTSFSTPQVAGAAAILLQAVGRGDAGSGLATNIQVIKALLLNGAQKPVGWTNSAMNPLDFRHGAGVLNVFQSYCQLRAGRQQAALSQSIALGGSHLPPPATNAITSRRGWDFAVASSSVTEDGIRHYFFNVIGASNRSLTATLVWNRQQNQTGINDLDLFLYRIPDNTLVASSVSLVDNVEHLSASNLPPGEYNLQVFKAGGLATLGKRVTNDESYALAFDFGPSQRPEFEPPFLAGGQFTARLSGEPNQRYLIQSASALPAWTPFLTNTTTSTGTLDVAMPPTGMQFFRALELP